jgi:hypothetical protein
MDGIAAGKLDEKLLLPEARDALSTLLEPPEQTKDKQGPASSYRLGKITFSGEDASLKLRLPFAGTGSESATAPREEGLLSLRKVDASWYVEALSLDPPVSGPLIFDPAIKDKYGN